ncbi:MAG: hypothetical protein ABL966_09590 [Acidimicrobiales bacterium]
MHPTTSPTTSGPSGLSWFFRNPRTGRVVVAQAPNLPLWIFLAATAVRLLLHPAGRPGTALSIVSGLALVVWAVWEIVSGASPFRRVLGAIVLAVSFAGLLMR